jgi:hypothetical protein
MNRQDWALALTLCRRELRGGLGGFGVFLGCLFLGVLAISAVGSLGRALEDLPPRVLIYGIETGQAPSLPPLGDLVTLLWPTIIDDIRVCMGESGIPSHVSSANVTPFSPANAHSIPREPCGKGLAENHADQ